MAHLPAVSVSAPSSSHPRSSRTATPRSHLSVVPAAGGGVAALLDAVPHLGEDVHLDRPEAGGDRDGHVRVSACLPDEVAGALQAPGRVGRHGQVEQPGVQRPSGGGQGAGRRQQPVGHRGEVLPDEHVGQAGGGRPQSHLEQPVPADRRLTGSQRAATSPGSNQAKAEAATPGVGTPSAAARPHT